MCADIMQVLLASLSDDDDKYAIIGALSFPFITGAGMARLTFS